MRAAISDAIPLVLFHLQESETIDAADGASYLRFSLFKV